MYYYFIFLVDNVQENYDDVVIIRQFSNDKAGVGFNLQPSRLEQGFLFFFKLWCNIKYVVQWCSNLLLEGQCPAEFSSILSQTHLSGCF